MNPPVNFKNNHLDDEGDDNAPLCEQAGLVTSETLRRTIYPTPSIEEILYDESYKEVVKMTPNMSWAIELQKESEQFVEDRSLVNAGCFGFGFALIVFISLL